MGNAEKKLGSWTPKKKEDKKALAQQPNNAATQKKSDPICPSSGCPEPKKNAEYPVDYKVPDFGVDHDIKDSLKHMKDQEADKGTWTLPKDKEGKIISSYPSNNTLASGKKPAEKQAIAVSADVQMKSDPICSSAGCTQYEHPKLETYPMDYPVANFGVDHDIKAT